MSGATMDGSWPRRRLLATLAAVSLTAVCLLLGLALAVWNAVVPTPTTPMTDEAAAAPGEVRGEAYRDLVAAQTMLKVPAAAASTPGVSADLAPTLLVPTSDAVGAAGVPAGFPHTPEGALAQLAAIEVTVVDAMSIPVAHAVHDAWSLPGGSSAAEWAMTRNVQVFLSTLGDQGNAKDGSVLVAATPAAGQVKGTDGPDWVLACVLLDVRAAVATTAGGGVPVVGAGSASGGITAALAWIGTPYSWGGGTASGPTTGICCSPGGQDARNVVGFDCSGLVLYAYAQIGISLPHLALTTSPITPVARSSRATSTRCVPATPSASPTPPAGTSSTSASTSGMAACSTATATASRSPPSPPITTAALPGWSSDSCRNPERASPRSSDIKSRRWTLLGAHPQMPEPTRRHRHLSIVSPRYESGPIVLG